MAATFHLFPLLPYEIRVVIWSFAVQQRFVYMTHETEFIVDPDEVEEEGLEEEEEEEEEDEGGEEEPSLPDRAAAVVFPAPRPPPVIHACRESRQHAPYKKAFLRALMDEPEDIWNVRPPGPDYIWINFEHDMICLDHSHVWLLAPHEAEIRRLRFMLSCFRYYPSYGWEHLSPGFKPNERMYKRFTALDELQIEVQEQFEYWHGKFWGLASLGACPRENVRFLEKGTGLVFTGEQAWMAKHWREAEGGRILKEDEIAIRRRQWGGYRPLPPLDLESMRDVA